MYKETESWIYDEITKDIRLFRITFDPNNPEFSTFVLLEEGLISFLEEVKSVNNGGNRTEDHP